MAERFPYQRNFHSFIHPQDGKLTIRVTHSVDGSGKSEYTSARLVTAGAVDFLYGRVDVRARLPAGTGTWPAIWLLPTDWSYGDWPASGGIGIMETVGRDLDVVHGTVHTAAYNHHDNTVEIGATGGRYILFTDHFQLSDPQPLAFLTIRSVKFGFRISFRFRLRFKFTFIGLRRSCFRLRFQIWL